ncbi:MAG TPA: hypothetical protein VGQ37_18405 [Vicinamibacterales bacterium]|nr:hypothetical protein [Vicinamibacterales bacterium]
MNPGRVSSIDRFCWWLVDAMSGALDWDERAAARGDLTESTIPARRAVREMLGCAARSPRGRTLDRGWRC